MSIRAVACALCLSLCGQLVGVSAQAQAVPSAAGEGSEASAREAFARGRAAYDRGEFAQAASAFEEAYQLSGREGLLYNLYLAHRDAGQQEKAAEALRGYLARVENVDNRAQLEARLKALDAGIAERKAAEAAEQARVAERARAAEQTPNPAPAPVAPVAPQPAQGADRSWILPVVVMSAGGALMLASIGTGVASNKKIDKLEDECPDRDMCFGDLESTQQSGKTLAYVTDALLFTGLAAAAGGLVWLLVDRRSKNKSDSTSTPRADLACGQHGCSGSVSLRF